MIHESSFSDFPIIRSGSSALPRLQRRLIVPGSHPAKADMGVTAKKQDQLTGVVLGVPQVVQQELADGQVVPRESAALAGTLVSEPLESFITLPKAVLGVIEQLGPGEGLLRSGDDPWKLLVVGWQEHRIVCVEISCLECMLVVRQVEIRVEQYVVGEMPKGRAIGAFVPQVVRTGLEGGSQHLNRGGELPAYYGLPVIVHELLWSIIGRLAKARGIISYIHTAGAALVQVMTVARPPKP